MTPWEKKGDYVVSNFNIKRSQLDYLNGAKVNKSRFVREALSYWIIRHRKIKQSGKKRRKKIRKKKKVKPVISFDSEI